jgi:hypothetical protein
MNFLVIDLAVIIPDSKLENYIYPGLEIVLNSVNTELITIFNRLRILKRNLGLLCELKLNILHKNEKSKLCVA